MCICKNSADVFTRRHGKRHVISSSLLYQAQLLLLKKANLHFDIMSPAKSLTTFQHNQQQSIIMLTDGL